MLAGFVWAPDSGMAMGIGLAMLCLLALPTGVLAGLALYVTRRRSNGNRAGAVFMALLVGPVLGVVAIKLSFGLPWSYFANFVAPADPPAELTVELPFGYRHDWLAVIEDPTARSGFDLNAQSGAVEVRAPASGVLRVRDLTPILDAAPLYVSSDGERRFEPMMPSRRELPAGVTGRAWAAIFVGADYPGDDPALDRLPPSELTERLRELERSEP